MSVFGMNVIAIMLIITVFTWGTEWAISASIVGAFTAIMEWAKPHISNNKHTDFDDNKSHKR